MVALPPADGPLRCLASGEPTTGIAPLGLILAVAILALAAILLALAAARQGLRWPGLHWRGLLIQVALLSYRLAVLPIRRLSAYAREHAAVASLPELPAVLLVNGSRALGTLWRDWSATAPGFWIAGQLATLFQSRRFTPCRMDRCWWW